MSPSTNQARLAPLAPITVVTGHYGTGKTNFSLNLALHAKAAGQDVAVMDVDIVNPYFRSSDYTQMLEAQGIRVVAPVMAQTMLDTPSLPPAMNVAIQTASAEKPLIIDMGGDDEGAKAMGRFAERIKARPDSYTMYYVVNERREIETPEETAAMLREIEERCKLEATAVVNNTHLSEETTLDIVEASVPFAEETARILNLPLACTTVPAASIKDANVPNAFPVKRIVRMPWE